MDEMKLRGYVTPEEFEGTDAEKIQAAVKAAYDKDIRKVILKGEYNVDKTVYIYEQMHVIFDGAKIKATCEAPLFANYGLIGKDHSYSFQEDLFFFESKNGAVVEGDFFFYNAYRIAMERMEIKGTLKFEFCREIRLEYDRIEGKKNAIVFARGNNNLIIERIETKSSEAAIVMDAAMEIDGYTVGKEPDIHDMIIKDSKFDTPAPAIAMEANGESGIFNIVIEDNETSAEGITIGKASGNINPEKYRDITATSFKNGKEPAVILGSETFHCYLQK